MTPELATAPTTTTWGWTNPVMVKPGGKVAQIGAAPAVTVWEGRLYCAWRDDYTNQHHIHIAESNDGETWDEVDLTTLFPGRDAPTTDFALALTSFDGDLFLIYQHQTRGLWYLRNQGFKWGAPVQIRDEAGNSPHSMFSPAAAVLNEELFVVYRGPHQGAPYPYLLSRYNGSIWTKSEPLPHGMAGHSDPALVRWPASADWPETVVLAYQADSHGTIAYALKRGTSGWEGPVNNFTTDGKALTKDTPALAIVDGELFLVFRGASGDTIYFLRAIKEPEGIEVYKQDNITTTNHASSASAPAVVEWFDEARVCIRGRTGDQKDKLYSFNGSRWNGRLRDIKSAFENLVSWKCNVVQYRWRGAFDYDQNVNHIQGLARYKQWDFLARSIKPSEGQWGLIFVVNRETGLITKKLEIKRHAGFTHPGGCQVFDDYLAVSLAPNSGGGGAVVFYDLSDMSDEGPGDPLPVEIATDKHDFACVGLTTYVRGGQSRYWAGVYSSDTVYFYESSSASLRDPACKFVLQATHALPATDKDWSNQRCDRCSQYPAKGADSLALFTDVENGLWLVALTTAGEQLRPDNWEDAAYLCHVDLGKGLTVQAKRCLCTKAYEYTPLDYWAMPHCRWGATAIASGPDQMDLLCTSRNFTRDQDLLGVFTVDVDYFPSP
jgi:hypothetical protein